MPEVIEPRRRRASLLAVFVGLAVVLAADVPVLAQLTNPIVQRWASARVRGEETRFLLQMQQITADEAKGRNDAMNVELRAIQTLLNGMPRTLQADVRQQTETAFQARIVPLRQQWTQQLAEKARADQARFQQLSKELQADAEQSGKLQAERTLAAERAQRGEMPQAEAARTDQQLEQQVLVIRRKYDALDVERRNLGQRPYWAATFSKAETGYANRAVADGRIRQRLDDTRSEVGRDAHRAADLTLSMQRNAVFQRQRAMTTQEAQNLNATAQALLTTLQAKYSATSPSSADYRDRVTRLVQAGAAAQREQWERDAIAARTAMEQQAAAAAAATRAPAPAAAPPQVTAPVRSLTQDPSQAAETTGSSVAPSVPVRSPAGTRGAPAPRPAAVPATEAEVIPLVVGTTTPSFFGPSTEWTPVIVLLLVGGAGASAYALLGRRKKTIPRYTDVAAIHAPPAVVTPPAHSSPAATVVVDVDPEATLKDRMFAEQRAKYQARYNDAQDEVTAATKALAQLAPVLEAAHANVALLSKDLQSRVAALIVARYGGVGTLFLNAAILRPIWRLFIAGAVLFKIAVGIGVYYLLTFVYRLLTEVGIPQAVVVYLIVATVCFFVERHFQLKVPLAAFNRHSSEFGNVLLSYIYRDQQVHVRDGKPMLYGVRVMSSEKSPVAHEDVLADHQGTGSFLVTVGTLARFRMDTSGTITLLSASQTNEFMTRHGSLLTEAMNEQTTFATGTLPSFGAYGEAMWRKRRAVDAVPELEKLVNDVARIQQVWEGTYVSDAVFEFLFRAMDMFNVRDAATPPGLLLYGLEGNGKKHLARKIADTISAQFEQPLPSFFKTPDEIASVWANRGNADPLVVFIPKAESIFPKTEDGVSGQDALEWSAEWEKHEAHQCRVWVVMTAKSDQAIDQAILDRIGPDSRIEITPPDAAGRLAVLTLACREYQLASMPPQSVLRSIAGMSIEKLRRIVTVVKRNSPLQQPQERHWMDAIAKVRGVKPKNESKTWDRLVLPPKVKDQLRAACTILQDADEYRKQGVAVPNILLYGPPGTGKTEIAVTMANEAGVNFMSQKLSDLKGKHIGVSGQNVRQMFDTARAQAPTVLFIDEIDGVLKPRGSDGTDQYTDEMVFEFLSQTEGAEKSDRPVILLGATNYPETLEAAVLRRFQRRIEIPLPDEDGRRLIVKGLLQGKTLEPGLDLDVLCTEVAKRSNGQSGGMLRNAIANAMNNAVVAAGGPKNVRLTRALVFDAVDELVAQASDKVDSTARWDTLVLSEDTLTRLRQLSDALKHLETFQRQGIDPPKGGVLYGPPGTGKTQIAKTLANETGVTFLSRTGADLGDSARSVKKLFDEARAKAPCILFLDEFEKAGQSRDQGGSPEVVLELLQQIDGAKKTDRPVFVLTATNYLERLDEAILSRFDRYQIEIPNPGLEQREKLFAIVLNRYPLADFDVAALAAELARTGGGLSGRDITNVVGSASQVAMQRALRAGTPDHVVITREDLTNEVAARIKRRNPNVDSAARWETLVLSEETIRQLKRMSAAVRGSEERRKQGLPIPAGAVVYGPAGTGKTQIARTLANESEVQFLSATIAELTGEYIGASTQKVARLFADARKKSPCILFLDEFDQATQSRSGEGARNSFSGEVVSQILAEMDGVKDTGRTVFVLAATNYLENVDAAVLSRFDYKIEIPPPTKEQRVRLFEIALGKAPKVAFNTREMAAELADKTGDLVGRDIVKMVGKAITIAASRAEDAGSLADAVVTREDLMNLVAPVAGPEVPQEDVEAVWSQIVLTPAVKESLLGMVRLFNSGDKAAPKGLLLHGPPGTGKTEIARMLARSTGCEFLEADLSKVKGMYPGESAQKVKAIWDRARLRGRAVIFVDECDGIFARRGGLNTDQAVEEITTAFLPLWDGVSSGGQVWVVGATNKRERLDEAIEQRFGVSIEVGLPDAAARRAILALELKKVNLDVPVSEAAVTATNGLAGRVLSRITETVYRLSTQRKGVVTEDVWSEAVRQFVTPGGGDPIDEGPKWDGLVLPDATLKRLTRVCQMLRHADALLAQGIDPPRTLLLYGPPGSGKTTVARTFASETGKNFIAATVSDLKAGYVGQSAIKVRELFERARSKSAVLLIDEIEAAAPTRASGRADAFIDEIVPELLAQVDAVKRQAGHLFLIATAYSREAIDSSVLSRFQYQIELTLPGLGERARLLELLLRKYRTDFDVVEAASSLAARTEGLSGRNLEVVVRGAMQQAVDRAFDAGAPDQIVLTAADLTSQLASIQPRPGAVE